ncbi:uncharacterized protein [Ptychodera flava]|uniref:uncharacterized protein n=1 Tax=Ptychodera flava TaxID=63121 RepID=UPI003969CBAD
MLSTRRHSPSGSPGNGEEYSRRDRQRISAATDAAIENMRAMGPSPFATGHQPDTQDNEAEPDTIESGQTAVTSSSPSTSRRNSKDNGKEDKPKKHMGNKALIVGHNWGGPLQGGITDAVHLLARLLRELGIAVYCTTLTATEDEIKEAREYGVELIAPSPVKRFKVRGGKPDPDWLYHHKDYFPNLKELANVRFVFGFGMITSEAAFEIERDVFPKAAFYLINLFGRDVITPVVASCGAPELELRRESLCKEAEDSRYVFSVGGSTFREYKKMYKTSPNIKHYRLSPIIDESHFQIPSPDPVDDDDEFQILSLFQEHELEDLTKDSVIMKAMNAVAVSFQENCKPPPKWRILGVPKRWESDLKDRMDPHPKLKVVLARMPSAKVLNDEIGRSNLVLLPPASVHYVNLTLAAMSAAVPVIIPEESISHNLIKKHFSDHEEELVVNMSDENTLQEAILKFLCKYEIALERANTIKNTIQNNIQQELDKINNDFFQVARDDAKTNSGKDPISSEEKTKGTREEDDETKEAGSRSISKKMKLQGGDQCDMKVKVEVSEVVPENGRTVGEVERGFYESEEVKKKTKEVRQTLDGQHDEMKVKDVGNESISYTMSCQSLDALECLLGLYENGKLQDLMEDEFLTDELLDKIGAFYLAIDVTIDYEEYFMCRQELIQKHGIPSHSDKQPIDHGTTKSADKPLRRVNKARELLKAFQREGDDVTESQINILDQLLHEKEKMRQATHQKSLPQVLVEPERDGKDSSLAFQQQRPSDDSESTQMTDVHLLTDEEIEQKNEELEAKVNELMISSGIGRSRCREKGQGRDIGKALAMEGAREEESKLNPLLNEFLHVKSQTQDHETYNPELVMKTEKISAYADHIVSDAEIPEETKEVYLDVRRVEKG